MINAHGAHVGRVVSRPNHLRLSACLTAVSARSHELLQLLPRSVCKTNTNKTVEEDADSEQLSQVRLGILQTPTQIQ